MALQATHFAFACQLQHTLGIQDVAAYRTGALYPDSRYLTLQPREATHGEDCPSDPFKSGLTDFERGWATHLLYDQVVGEWQKGFIPEGHVLTLAHDAAWILFTAAKVVEDICVCVRIHAGLLGIQFEPTTERRHNEHPELLRQHFSMIKGLYLHGMPSLGAYEDYFAGFLPRETALRLVKAAEAMFINKEQRDRAAGFYTAMCSHPLLRSHT